MGWVGKIRRVGRVVESAAPKPAAAVESPPGIAGSLQVRHVDAGSGNGCGVELSGAFSSVYDAERFGARLVASPRHADALAVTGVVTRNMAQPLRNTLDAVPTPRVVIAIGDCACNRGMFADGYAVVGAVSDVIPVDVEVPGCPPRPQEIIDALLGHEPVARHLLECDRQRSRTERLSEVIDVKYRIARSPWLGAYQRPPPTRPR
jgi:formate hydrogenlyase subunit 7